MLSYLLEPFSMNSTWLGSHFLSKWRRQLLYSLTMSLLHMDQNLGAFRTS
ncbi:hypothetical protein RchiOBHm_Chr4g0400121 [Rosa chinensis]|uniref:Uncharacterized protein n=1 Tax=Rosa chinensis TaxID=74649 RepID=A0A2P6QSR7_ROSCH|nr:hypothetical protein RchiOBHm_Chr4g0400121 [Rosa chinensis]